MAWWLTKGGLRTGLAFCAYLPPLLSFLPKFCVLFQCAHKPAALSPVLLHHLLLKALSWANFSFSPKVLQVPGCLPLFCMNLQVRRLHLRSLTVAGQTDPSLTFSLQVRIHKPAVALVYLSWRSWRFDQGFPSYFTGHWKVTPAYTNFLTCQLFLLVISHLLSI